MKKWILFVAIILLLCSSVARADDFDDAIDAYQKGNHDQAIDLFRLLATKGNAAAQDNLGVMYDKGKGVTQDYQEALKWYRLAAEQGYATAQNNLGVMYVMGKGVTQDYVRARMWFNLAARKGDEDAKENRLRIAKKMTLSQVSEAQKMARDCKRKNFKNCE
jgi:TPR repeat protein